MVRTVADPWFRKATDPDADGANFASPRFLLAYYLVGSSFWAAIAVRAVGDTRPDESDVGRWVAVLLTAFLVLFLTAIPIGRHFAWYPHVYLALQAGLVFAFFLSRTFPEVDYIAALLIPVSAHVFLLIPGSSRYRWIAVFILVAVIGLTVAQGWPAGLPFALLYASSYVFVASYAVVIEQAERARAQSRELLRDLQVAYDRLQEYAAQAEELAVMAERTRLARDLHDAVSQNLYGLTLSAETADRALRLGRSELASAQLDEIRAAARQALGELRLLVFELRPAHSADFSLAESLRARLDTVESRAGLVTELRVVGDRRLPAPVEREFDRIAQEALNNVIKHAHAGAVSVELALDGPAASMTITDDGAGFDVQANSGGLGLPGMVERAERIGGKLTVTSEPGQGTRVMAEVPA